MLQSLRIKNLALLEEVALEFEPGFTAVTGETGAGKSILLGALTLLAGERADKTIIRQGAPACEAEASLYFRDSKRIDGALTELELPPCEEGQLILRRVLAVEKPPRITVNGALATLAALQRLGEHWIDFHGPGEPRRLLRESSQLELLDLYAHSTGSGQGRGAEPIARYREKYQGWRRLIAEREQVVSEGRLSPDQVDFLRNELTRFESVELTEEAVEKLERDSQRMSRAQELIGLAETIAGGLTGEDGVQFRLSLLLREARQIEGIDPASKVLAERLSSAAVELNDLGAEFSALAQELQFDPEEAEQTLARMNTWLDLRRKHGGSLAAVIEARDAMQRKLDAQGDVAGTLQRLDDGIVAALKAVKKEAQAVRKMRDEAAKDLTKAAGKSLGQLGFKKAEFLVRVDALPEPGPNGDCSCQFLFSPNVGEPPLPLSRIASSGELARVMLALKTVLADLDAVPLLVFDEVDANVGGEVGRVVGEKMAAISRNHQVLCVTHLPQVAAQAASHLVVSKDQSGARAVVTIAPIQSSRKARVSELARMLGDRSAKSAIAHAEEMLGNR